MNLVLLLWGDVQLVEHLFKFLVFCCFLGVIILLTPFQPIEGRKACFSSTPRPRFEASSVNKEGGSVSQ